jgi:RimJ/RimL family protein N-acetyltransferase
MVTLKTARLVLRPLVPQDAGSYASIRYHPDVVKWLLPAPVDPIAAAHAAIERYATGWREHGHGPWGLFCGGWYIGHAGLNYVPVFGKTEVLWSLHPDAWHQGYATEAAQAALQFGFGERGLKSIFAVTKPDNIASQAVMTRLGLSYARDVVYQDVPSVWFEIDREAYGRRRKNDQ